MSFQSQPQYTQAQLQYSQAHQRTSGSSSLSTVDSHSSDYFHSPQAYIASVNDVADPNWYLDSGTIYHVTADLENFSTKHPYSGQGMLTVGDGSQLPISCIGSMVSSSTKNHDRPIALHDILLFPSITKNLISTSKFTMDNNVIVEFNSSCCYVKDKVSKASLLWALPLEPSLTRSSAAPITSTSLLLN